MHRGAAGKTCYVITATCCTQPLGGKRGCVPVTKWYDPRYFASSRLNTLAKLLSADALKAQHCFTTKARFFLQLAFPYQNFHWFFCPAVLIYRPRTARLLLSPFYSLWIARVDSYIAKFIHGYISHLTRRWRNWIRSQVLRSKEVSRQCSPAVPVHVGQR